MKAIKILKAFTNAIFMTKEDILKVEEAIVELKELQNRSCNNCKNIKKYNKTEWECKKSVKTNYFSNYIEHSFCCNKWESK